MVSIIPGSSPALGLFASSNLNETMGSFSANTGRSVPIVHMIIDWAQRADDGTAELKTFTDSNPAIGNSVTQLIANLASEETVVAISWDPLAIDDLNPGVTRNQETPLIDVNSILSGDHDAYIRQVAQQVGDLDVPVMMSLFGESNIAAQLAYGADGTSYRDTVSDLTGHYGDPTALDGPERVRDVFRHVIDLFNEEGASNVSWYMYLGSDYGEDPRNVPIEAIYPGDDYISWVGQSVYVDSASELGKSLDVGYAAWGQVTNNPFFIPELGNKSTGGAEITALLNGLAQYERIGAVTWTDFEEASSHYGLPRLGDGAGDWNALKLATGFSDKATVESPEGIMDFGTWRDVTGRSATDYHFYGTDGEDYLIGESGADTLIGKGGNDYYLVDSKLDKVIEEPGKGHDTITTKVNYTLSAHVEDLIITGDNNANGYGNEASNLIIGDNSNNHLVGKGGEDTISAGSGFDKIEGGDGDDVLLGADGKDILRGDAGRDTLLGENGNDKLYGGAGNDSLLGGNGHDELYGGIGDDEVVGESGNDRLFLGDGNDTGRGGIGADMIYGGGGNDVLLGEDGRDILNGGDGKDSLLGGNGHDELYGGIGDDEVVGESGNDRLFLGDGNDTGRGGAGSDKIYGGNGDDVLLGEDGGDILYGGDGADTILGDAGNDRLTGGKGNDLIDGGAGNDWIHTGAGDDYVTGGDGEDIFVFEGAGGRTVIGDFDASQDVLDLSAHNVGGLQALRAVARDVDDGLLIVFGDSQLTITGMSQAELSSENLLF